MQGQKSTKTMTEFCQIFSFERFVFKTTISLISEKDHCMIVASPSLTFYIQKNPKMNKSVMGTYALFHSMQISVACAVEHNYFF